MTFTWYIPTQLLGHTRLQRPASHMLTPSLSPEYEVAGKRGVHSRRHWLTRALFGHKVWGIIQLKTYKV